MPSTGVVTAGVRRGMLNLADAASGLYLGKASPPSRRLSGVPWVSSREGLVCAGEEVVNS